MRNRMLSTFKIDNTNKEQLILKSDDFIFENKFIFYKLKYNYIY